LRVQREIDIFVIALTPVEVGILGPGATETAAGDFFCGIDEGGAHLGGVALA
jgi:hypothetical protein